MLSFYYYSADKRNGGVHTAKETDIVAEWWLHSHFHCANRKPITRVTGIILGKVGDAALLLRRCNNDLNKLHLDCSQLSRICYDFTGCASRLFLILMESLPTRAYPLLRRSTRSCFIPLWFNTSSSSLSHDLHLTRIIFLF